MPERFAMYTPDLADAAWSCPGCPEGPGWALDWASVLAAHPALQGLAGTPQDVRWHGEGDVLRHTRQVAAALVADSAWRALPPTRRAVLFAAALYHDIAKPECTVVEADGVHAPHHARVGALRVRGMLWQEAFEPVPFVVREALIALVRHHGLPIWFLEKDDPERALRAVSLRVPLTDL